MSDFAALHWLDLTVFGLLAGGLLIGWMSGFTRMLLGTIRLAASIALSILLYSHMREIVAAQFADSTSALADVATGLMTFLASWLIVLLVVRLLQEVMHRLLFDPASRTIGHGVKKSGLSPLNRMLGGLFGFTIGAFPALLLLGILYWKPGPGSDEQLKQSRCGPIAVACFDDVAAEIPDRHQRELNETAQRLRQQAVETAARSLSEILDVFRQKVDEKLDRKDRPENERLRE